jgi:hypothetical protein
MQFVTPQSVADAKPGDLLAQEILRPSEPLSFVGSLG